MVLTDYIFKVLLIGPDSSKRKELAKKFLSGIFEDSPRLTVGVDFYSKKIKLNNNKRVKLQVWDYGGESRYRFLLPTYY